MTTTEKERAGICPKCKRVYQTDDIGNNCGPCMSEHAEIVAIVRNHLSGCPQRDNPNDDCMCDYIAQHRPKRRHALRVTCREGVRQMALEHAAKLGCTNIERVSNRFIAAVEREALNALRRRVDALKHRRSLKTLL